jgi:hypothetical protein
MHTYCSSPLDKAQSTGDQEWMKLPTGVLLPERAKVRRRKGMLGGEIALKNQSFPVRVVGDGC